MTNLLNYLTQARLVKAKFDYIYEKTHMKIV
jgi:hypothetical protein